MKQPVTVDGFRVVASAGMENLPPLPIPNDRFEVAQRGYFTRRYRCGHRDAWWFVFHIWGEKTRKIRQRQECGECLLARWRENVIRCAKCGLMIVPGSAIALYRPDPEIFRPEWTTEVDEGVVVGCLRMACCPSGGFYSGNWTGKDVSPLSFKGNENGSGG